MFKFSLLLNAACDAMSTPVPKGANNHQFREMIPLTGAPTQMMMPPPQYGVYYGNGYGGMGYRGYGMHAAAAGSGGVPMPMHMPMMMMMRQPSYIPFMSPVINSTENVNSTNSSQVSQGNYNNQGANNQGFLNSASASQLNQMRRLEAMAELQDAMHHSEVDDFEGVLDAEDDEIIDGQHFMYPRRGRQRYGYGGGHGYGNPYGINHGYNSPYMPINNHGGSYSGYNNQNRMMNQGARQGYYDQGDVYQNQSGWDRGYNNTNSRSYRRGGMNDRHRSGMHQNQMGHNQNRMDYLPYNGGSYAGGMF